jgi:eukaryotic-like serine/threonine-protein kinase
MKIYPRGARIGPYEVVELLPTGRGGMAAVYLARPRPGHAASSPPLVALKVAETPHDDFLKYEAEHLEHLRHPNIVQVLPIPHTGTNQNRSIFIARTEPTSSTSPFYIAVAYMRGGSVEQLLKLRGRLTLIEAVEIACQVAEALIYLHSQQLVHLDIKGSNILFREPLRRWKAKVPQVVVSDFGIAWSTEREQLPTVYGSQFYTAPERAAGEPPRPHNDIFSLGVLLYEMLAGRMPFTGVVAPGAVVAEHARPSCSTPPFHPNSNGSSSKRSPPSLPGATARCKSSRATWNGCPGSDDQEGCACPCCKASANI